MSHVATIDIHIRDLGALGAACKRLGLELKLDQKTYKWFGTHVGDYLLPQGFTAAELGQCEHAIAVQGAGPSTYEVGVVARRDGKPGYTLMWDFWAGGYGLQEKVGQDCKSLKQMYAIEVAKKQALANGFQVSEKWNQTNECQLVLNK